MKSEKASPASLEQLIDEANLQGHRLLTPLAYSVTGALYGIPDEDEFHDTLNYLREEMVARSTTPNQPTELTIAQWRDLLD